MKKIAPYLWFDQNAEEAMNFYVSVFKGSPRTVGETKIVGITRYEKGMDVPGGDDMVDKVINGEFMLNGQTLFALDGGPVFKFNESISMFVECEDQKEVDYFWEKLSAVPESEQCGWLKDKFGLSWQIIPTQLNELFGSTDRQKALAAINAMLQMKKIVIADLERAFEQG